MFTNPFLSVEGQRERFSNVAQVLKTSVNPFDRSRVSANIRNKTLDRAVEFAANRPFETAALAAAPFSSGVRKNIVRGVSKLSPVKKAITASAAALGIGVLGTSEKARVTSLSALETVTPSNFLRAGAELGNVIENPNRDNTQEFFQNNKGLLVAGALATATVFGAKAAPAITSGLVTGLSINSPSSPQLPKEKEVKNKPKETTPGGSQFTAPSATTEAPADVVSAQPKATNIQDKPKKMKVRRKRKLLKKPNSCKPCGKLTLKFC